MTHATTSRVAHYYVFIYRSLGPCYERTCGTRDGADLRVHELNERGMDAFWLEDELPTERWYY